MRPLPATSLLLLAMAVLEAPLAAQQESGADDFRISYMGGTGDVAFRADSPAIAYNATANEYLVVWKGDTNTGGQVDDRYQVFGQRFDAATRSPIGAAFEISANVAVPWFVPPYAPSVAWDSTLDQYLVVWSGITGECCEIDYEIFSRRVTALGVPLGAQLQISHMSGPVENPNEAHYDAYDPAVVYNPAAAEFLVVWSGDEGRDGYLNDEFEIRGQRIDAATGAQVGADDFPVSDAGSTSNIASSAYLPDVAYNLADDEYLVTWGAEDPDAGTADGEFEIFGQRLDGSSGAELGTNDFRISTVGPPGNTHYFTIASAVAYDAADNEYLVAFCATEYAEAAFVRAFDVFGQRLDSAGAEIGVDDFRLSDFGEFGDPAWNCEGVDVAYSAAAGAYLVSFSGDDNRAGQLDGELEVFVQMVDADSGTEVGPNDLRVSDMGPNGSSTYQAFSPVLAADTSGGLLLVWTADDNSGGLVDSEFEIFGQFLTGPLFADGFEGEDTLAWSVTVP